MRPTLFLPLLLPTLTLAADSAQKPLQEKAKGWLSAAKSYVPTAFPTVPGLTAVPVAPKPTSKSPISHVASKVAALKVHPLTMSNYRSTLTSTSNTPQEWLVFVTGGNKTCGGHCHNLDVAWNETASILAADPAAPKMAVINCDNEKILCATWTCKPPTIWHFVTNDPAQEGKTDIHINYLNFTKTTAGDMVALHTGDKWKEGYKYEGAFHLFDGWMIQYGLFDAAGYLGWALGLVPSWAFMLVVSMGSRHFINSRYGANPDRARQAQAQQAGAGAGNAPRGGAPAANER